MLFPSSLNVSVALPDSAWRATVKGPTVYLVEPLTPLFTALVRHIFRGNFSISLEAPRECAFSSGVKGNLLSFDYQIGNFIIYNLLQLYDIHIEFGGVFRSEFEFCL